MRVVDLRSSAPPRLELRATASEPAELLRLIGVLASANSPNVPGDYDVGAARIDEVRNGLPPGVLDRARDLGDDRSFLSLSIVAAELPEGATTDDLLERLESDPARSWRILLGLSVGELDWPDAQSLSIAVQAGRDDALDEIRARCGLPSPPDDVRKLFDVDPVEHGRRIAEVARRVRDAVWAGLAEEALRPIRRDVEHRRAAIERGEDPREVILTATNGYELGDDPTVRRVLLLPSFWMRPWLVVDQIDDLLVISTPVADEFLCLPSEAPSPALLKLFKALSDEGRLKLLRRLAAGPTRLVEAAEHLGVSKPTAHHHLAILRQAGLVTMSGEGRGTRYALRQDPSDMARDALAAYVPPTAG